MAEFLNGAAAMSCMAIAIYFARFWRETGDRLFWCLAAAFWLFAANYGAIGLLPVENQRSAFAVRLVGFATLLVGILLKDRELTDHLTGDRPDDAI